MKKNKVSAAQMAATKKYEEKNYDKILVRLPKGTKDKIAELGYTYNGFINDAVREKLAE